VLLVENSRIPFDDPNTHLELTMIHEVMVLDHSGPALGMIQYGAAMKLFVMGAVLLRVVAPFEAANAWADWGLFVAGMLGLAVVTGWVLRRTAAGLFIEATGDNEKASRLAGIQTGGVRLAVYGFSGFCAGLSGVLEAANISAADPARIGDTRELDAIFAVVAGGTALTGGRFSLAGSVVGALLLQTLTLTLYNQNVAPAVAPVPKAVVILAVCLLHSPRLRARFGKRTQSVAA
jgi:simple sugar transport system permease protein